MGARSAANHFYYSMKTLVAVVILLITSIFALPAEDAALSTADAIVPESRSAEPGLLTEVMKKADQILGHAKKDCPNLDGQHCLASAMGLCMMLHTQHHK